MRRTGPPPRKLTRVAVGVLIQRDGRVLLADRPAGKPYAGYWEFPGGKIELGEDVAAALQRELHEELGIEIGRSAPWVTFEFDYPHAHVELQFRLVHEWRGDPHSREGQQMGFFDPAGPLPQPLLPAAVPALRWLQLPPTIVVTAPRTASALTGGLPDSTRSARCAQVPVIVVEADWRAAGSQVDLHRILSAPAMQGRRLLVSGPGAQEVRDGAGWVLEAAELAACRRRADATRAAWVDAVGDLQLAVDGGCDFVLVRSDSLAEELSHRPPALPAYLPQRRAPAGTKISTHRQPHWRWHDLRLAQETAA